MAESSDVQTSFDFRVIHDGFSAALLEDEDVDLPKYAEAYRELNKFFQLMGSVFSFVGSDVKSKIEILENLCSSPNGHNFQSVKLMMKYEIDENLLKKKDYVSGSRTLLRLHRGLDFLRIFLRKVSELEDTEGTVNAGQTAYSAALAKHHPWLVRKGATVAMYALPSRRALLMKVCGNDENEMQKALDILPTALFTADEVFSRIDQCYTKHNLHDLP